jgi:hypothetical protein
MRQLVQDCKLMLAEMDLTEKGRTDRSQLVNIAPVTAGAREANEQSQSSLA